MGADGDVAASAGSLLGPPSDDAWATGGLAGAGGDSGGRGGPAAAERDPEETARQICLRMLAVAPKTRAQLAGALQRRGVPEEAAEAVLGRFADVKLIDDAMFANAWVESRHYSRGLSGRALAAELRQRGVPAADIRAAVDGLDPEQEVATARNLVARRVAAIRGQPTPADVRRLIGMLARKGYPPALAFRLTREALEKRNNHQAVAWLELGDEVGEFLDGAADPDAFGA
jgi:regulatory protein